MKRLFLNPLLCLLFADLIAQELSVVSPDKQLRVNFSLTEGKPMYSVSYKGKSMIENSPLGLQSNEGDFASGMKFLNKADSIVDKSYTQDKIKTSQVHYTANRLTVNLENARQKKIS